MTFMLKQDLMDMKCFTSAQTQTLKCIHIHCRFKSVHTQHQPTGMQLSVLYIITVIYTCWQYRRCWYIFTVRPISKSFIGQMRRWRKGKQTGRYNTDFNHRQLISHISHLCVIDQFQLDSVCLTVMSLAQNIWQLFSRSVE